MTQAQRPDSARRPTLARWAVAFFCWVAFIWGHSLVQGPQSSLESGLVVALLEPLFNAVGVRDAGLMTLIVRKGAHFSEYAVLGILAFGLFRARIRERSASPLPPACLVPLVAVADECLQLFVPGRSGQPTDVLVDLAGICAGALLAGIVSTVRRRV